MPNVAVQYLAGVIALQTGIPSEGICTKLVSDTVALAFLSGGCMSFLLFAETGDIITIQPIQLSLLLPICSNALQGDQISPDGDTGTKLNRTHLLVLNLSQTSPADMNLITELSCAIQIINISKSSILEAISTVIDRIYIDSGSSSQGSTIIHSSLDASLLSIMRDFSQRLADKATFLRYGKMPIIRFYSSESMRANLENLISSYQKQGPSTLNRDQVTAFSKLFMNNVSRVVNEISTLEGMYFKDFDRLHEQFEALDGEYNTSASHRLATCVQQTLRIFDIHVHSLLYGYETLLNDIQKTINPIESARAIFSDLVDGFVSSSLPLVNDLLTRFSEIEAKVLYHRELAALIEYFKPLIDAPADGASRSHWKIFKQLTASIAQLKDRQHFSTPEKSTFLYYVHFYLTYTFIHCLWSTVRSYDATENSFLFGFRDIMQELTQELATIKSIERYMALSFKLMNYKPPYELQDAEILIDFAARLMALSGALVDIQKLLEQIKLLCETVPSVPTSLLDIINDVISLVRTHELSKSDSYACTEPMDCSQRYIQQLCYLFTHVFTPPGTSIRSHFPSNSPIAVILRGLTAIPGLSVAMESYEAAYKSILDSLFSPNNFHSFITRYGEHFSRFAIVASLQPETKNYFNILIVKFTTELTKSLSQYEQNSYSRLRASAADQNIDHLLIREVISYCKKAIQTGDSKYLQQLHVDDIKEAVSSLLIREQILPNFMDVSLLLYAQNRIFLSVEFLGVLLTRACASKIASLTSISKVSTALAKNLNAFSSKYIKWTDLWAELLISSAHCPEQGLDAPYLLQFLCEYTYTFERQSSSDAGESLAKVELSLYHANPLSFNRLPRTLHLLATSQTNGSLLSSSLHVTAPVPSLFTAQDLCNAFIVAGRLPSTVKISHSSIIQKYQPLFEAISGIFIPAITMFSRTIDQLVGWIGTAAGNVSVKVLENQCLSFYLCNYVTNFYALLHCMSIFIEVCPNYLKFYSLNDLCSTNGPVHITPFYAALFSTNFWSLPLQLVHVVSDFSNTYNLHANSPQTDHACIDGLPGKDTIDAYTVIFTNQSRQLYRAAAQFDSAFIFLVNDVEVIKSFISELVIAKPEMLPRIFGQLTYAIQHLDANNVDHLELATHKALHLGRQAAHYNVAIAISRILTTKLVYSLFVLKEQVLGETDVLQQYQDMLAYTDYHQFRSARYSVSSFVTSLCKDLTIFIDTSSSDSVIHYSRALISSKIPDFLAIIENIVASILEYELPVDPLAVRFVMDSSSALQHVENITYSVLSDPRQIREVRAPTVEAFSRMMLAIPSDALHGSELKLHHNMQMVMRLLGDARAAAIQSTVTLRNNLSYIYLTANIWNIASVTSYVASLTAEEFPLQILSDILDLTNKSFQEFSLFLSNTASKDGFLRLVTLSVSNTFRVDSYNKFKAFQKALLVHITECLLSLVKHLILACSGLISEAQNLQGANVDLNALDNNFEALAILKWLTRAQEVNRLYEKHSNLLLRLQTDLMLTEEARNSLGSLLSVTYPSFSNVYNHLKDTFLADKSMSFSILAKIQSMRDLFQESSLLNVCRVTDPSLMFTKEILLVKELDAANLFTEVQGVRQRLLDLQKDLSDIIDISSSASTLLGVHMSSFSAADKDSLVMGVAVIDAIYLPFCREIQQLLESLQAKELRSAIFDCDPNVIDAVLASFCHNAEVLVDEFMTLRGLFSENASVVSWLDHNSSVWRSHSTITLALLSYAKTITELRPYNRQFCDPSVFHPSHWPALLAELRPVCSVQEDFPAAQNFQSRIQHYTIADFIGHLFLFLRPSGQASALQQEEGVAATQMFSNQEPLRVLLAIFENILSQARARSSVYNMISSYTLLSKSIPLAFTYLSDIIIVKNLPEVIKNLESALVSISDISSTSFYLEFGPQLLDLQEIFMLYLSAAKAMLDVQIEYIQLSSVLAQNLSIIRRYIKEAVLKYEAAITDLTLIYGHLSEMPSQTTTDNLVNLFSFLGGVEACTNRLLAIHDALQHTTKALGTFIEQQRYISPRLFFLTDENILGVISALSTISTVSSDAQNNDESSTKSNISLANSNEIQVLEKNLRKIFPGFAHLVFAPDTPFEQNIDHVMDDGLNTRIPDMNYSFIIGLRSLEDEVFQLEKSQRFNLLALLRTIKNEVAIHPFLLKFETSIRLSVYEQIRRCYSVLCSYVNNPMPIQSSQIPQLLEVSACQTFIVGLQILVTKTLDLYIMTYRDDDLTVLKELLQNLLVYIRETYKTSYKLHCLLPEIIFLQSTISVDLEHKSKSEIQLEHFFRMKVYIQENEPSTGSFGSSQWNNIYESPIIIRVLSHEHIYSCNYIGSSPRLVQTTLTSSHYTQSLISIGSQFFVSPIGPAGTGKTESTRQLASHLGRPCFVFNCDEAFDYQSVVRIMLGSLLLGCIVCFDEFNRLTNDNLSSISLIVDAIQKLLSTEARAKRASRNNEGASETLLNGELQKQANALLAQFTTNLQRYDLSHLAHAKEFACFITMNPFYKGRRTLPKNIAVLFRTVVMAQADIEAIINVLLLSLNFTTNNTLSKLICRFYTQLENVLEDLEGSRDSSVKSATFFNYDFGLRSIRTALHAGQLFLDEDASLRTLVDESSHEFRGLWEKYVIITGIRRSFLPTLAHSNLELFNNLLLSVFGPCEQQIQKELQMRSPQQKWHLLIRESLRKNMQLKVLEGYTLEKLLTKFIIQCTIQSGLVPTASFVRKVEHFHACICINMGIILAGESSTGKTTVQQVYYRARKACSKFLTDLTGIAQRPIIVQSTSPCALQTKSKLFGTMTESPREWIDSSFLRNLRNALALSEADKSNIPPELSSWPTIFFLLDCDIDPDWIEAFNSVLDGNRCLTLCTGERIYIPQNVRFIFESSTLRHATLATISRCSVSIHYNDVVTSADIVYGNLRQQLILENQHTSKLLSLLSKAKSSIFPIQPPMQTKTRCGTAGEKIGVLSNLSTRTYVLASLNIIAFDVFSSLLFKDATENLTFHQAFGEYTDIGGYSPRMQIAVSVTSVVQKSRLHRQFTNTELDSLNTGGNSLDNMVKNLLSHDEVASISFSDTVTNLIDYAAQLSKKHSPIEFSITRTILTLITILKNTVLEVEKYFLMNMVKIDLGLTDTRISIRNMEFPKLMSPQMVSQVLSFGGVPYNMLVLFYVRRFILALSWALGSQLPQIARQPLSAHIYHQFVAHFDALVNNNFPKNQRLETSSDDDKEDLEFTFLAISYFTIYPRASELFAGINISETFDASNLQLDSYGPTNEHTLHKSQHVDNALFLSTVVPSSSSGPDYGNGRISPDEHHVSSPAPSFSLLNYVCSIDNEYWQLNDPENAELRTSFLSKMQDSMSALIESSLNASSRRARFQELQSSRLSGSALRDYHNPSATSSREPSIVPNIDTQAYSTYLDFIIDQGTHVLLIGPTGSGKTMLLTHVLQQKQSYQVVFTSFSAQTSPTDIISILFRHFNLIPKDDHYELVSSSKQKLCLIIDEVNLVDANSFGLQPAIEFLRFLLEYKYFIYDGVLPESQIKRHSQDHGPKEAPQEISTIITLSVDILLACSCNPPADAGRALLSERFLRQFSILYLDTPSRTALLSIYTAYIEDMFANLSTEISTYVPLSPDLAHALSTSLSNAMVTAYEQIIALTDRKHSFYIYSPRDLTRWIGAVRHHCRFYALNNSQEGFSYSMFVQLILYEGSAVFLTKLTTELEQIQIANILIKSIQPFVELLNRSMSTQIADTTVLGIATFNTLILQKSFNLGISSLIPSELLKYSESILTEDQAWRNLYTLFSRCYSKANSLTLAHMQLVGGAIYHIVRTLSTPLGHLIINAEPGIITTPLLQFLAWLSGSSLIELRTTRRYSLSDFQEFLRNTIELAVTKPENVLLVISHECGLAINFLEYMNNFLCNGDMPGLFTNDKLHTLLVSAGLSELSQLRQLIKQKLHVLFTATCIQEESISIFSPALYNRCQLISISGMSIYTLVLEAAEYTNSLKLPAITSGSEDAADLILQTNDTRCEQSDDRSWTNGNTGQLLDILREQRNDNVLEIQDTLSIAAPGLGMQQRLCSALAILHTGIAEIIQRHQNITGFLSLPGILEKSATMRSITLFSALHYKRCCQSFITLYAKAYSEFCSQQEHLSKGLQVLDVVQNHVSALQEELRTKRSELADMTRITQDKLSEITKVREVAMASKAESVKLSIEITQKHEYIQARMGSIQSELAEAEPALVAARGSIRTISKTALEEIRRMARPAEAITLVMAAVVIIITPEVADINTNWEAVRKIMQRTNFQSSILAYNPAEDEHAAYRLERLAEYQANPSFKRDTIHHASQPAGLLFDWVMSTYNFLKIRSKVQPLEQALLQIKNEATDLETKRAELMMELVTLEKNIDSLTTECTECEAHQIRLQNQTDECESNAKQALVITDLLSDEIEHWKEQHADAESRRASLPGDMLLDAFYQTYVGCYTDNLRSELSLFVEETLEALSIQYSQDKTSFCRDSLSNYTLIDRIRCPTIPILLFDYTKGDLAYLRNTYKRHILISALSSDLMANVERALKFGFVIIIEDGDALDPELFLLHRITEQANLVRDASGNLTTGFTVEITGNILTVHPDFCAIILCQNIGRVIHFAAKCSVINFAQSEEKTLEIISEHIAKALHPALYTSKTQIKSELSAHAITIVSLEKELLHALSAVDQDSILRNVNLTSHLQTTKAKYRQIRAQREALQHQTKEYDALKIDLCAPAKCLAQIFAVMRRLRIIENGFIFTLEQMLHILDVSLSSYEKLAKKSYSDLIIIFLSICYNNVQSSLTPTMRGALRKFFEEIVETESHVALAYKQATFNTVTSFADYYAFYKKYTNVILLNVIGDTDPKTIVQTIIQSNRSCQSPDSVIYSLPFGSPNSRIQRISSLLKSIQPQDIALFTNMHLAPSSYCEDLCRVLQEYLKIHNNGALIVLSIQGTEDNNLTEEIYSLATSLDCISFVAQKDLSSVALYEQVKQDAEWIALESIHSYPVETTSSLISRSDTGDKKLNEQFIDLLNRIVYTYVIFRIRADMRPYGFVEHYSFTSADLRYAIELFVGELLNNREQIKLKASSTPSTVTKDFLKQIAHKVCFGNQISAMHDKIVAACIINKVFEMEVLPPMVDSCTGVFLNGSLDEIMKSNRRKEIEGMAQVILGRATHNINGARESCPATISKAVVGAVISRLLDLRKVLLRTDHTKEAKMGSNWNSFASMISRISDATKESLLECLHAAEQGPESLFSLQRSLKSDVLQHVTFLIDRFNYCNFVLSTLNGGGQLTEFLPLKLGPEAYTCFKALCQDMLNRSGTSMNSSEDPCVIFETESTDQCVAIIVKSFLCTIENGTVWSSSSNDITTLYMRCEQTKSRKQGGVPVFLDDTRLHCLGYVTTVNDPAILLEGCSFYFL